MFRVIPQSKLSSEHFDEYPVWSEHYDYDEIDDIVDWGINKEWCLQEFEEKEKGNEHSVYPVLRTEPLPDRMRIFIKAEFRTDKGRVLKGYVMNEDAFCITIFSGKEDYTFSSHPMLWDLNKESLRKLSEAEGMGMHDVFPLNFSTNFTRNDGTPIEGIASPPTKPEQDGAGQRR